MPLSKKGRVYAVSGRECMPCRPSCDVPPLVRLLLSRVDFIGNAAALPGPCMMPNFSAEMRPPPPSQSPEHSKPLRCFINILAALVLCPSRYCVSCFPSKMDPVGAAANLIAIIHAATRVVRLCQRFLSAVEDAPTELRAILIEVSTLRAVLQQLETLVSCNQGQPVLDALGLRHGPIDGCRKVLLELENLLPEESAVAGVSKRKAVLTALAWIPKDHKAKALLDELREYKSTITLALATDSS